MCQIIYLQTMKELLINIDFFQPTFLLNTNGVGFYDVAWLKILS